MAAVLNQITHLVIYYTVIDYRDFPGGQWSRIHLPMQEDFPDGQCRFDITEVGLIPGLGRSLRGEHSNPLQ